MAERIEAADAPPPPPPDDGPPDRNPEVTPELSDALGRDDQDADATQPDGSADQQRRAEPPTASTADVRAGPAGPDAREQAPDQDLSRPEPEKPDLPRADVRPELRSAIAEPDDAVTASGLDGQAGIGLPDAPGPGDRVDAPAAGKEAELSSDGLDGFRSAMADATDEDASAVGTGTDPAVDTETEPVVDEGTDPVADDGTGTGDSSSGSDDASVTDQPDWPDPDSIRITPDRATHILDGDDTGGGHRAGTGNPGKTEFPADWDDDKILGNIENVARNPDVKPDEPQPKGQWLYEGSRDGVHTYVVVNPDGTVRTAWPREGDPGVVRNPKKG